MKEIKTIEHSNDADQSPHQNIFTIHYFLFQNAAAAPEEPPAELPPLAD